MSEAGVPSVIVASHERSGTHFLMNALAGAYGYQPWLDLDPYFHPIDCRNPAAVEEFLDRARRENPRTIVKNHLALEFFNGILDRILQHYVIFYIYRDPVDVMLSFFRFVHGIDWYAGPKSDDPLVFARTPPIGQMTRYDYHDHRSIIFRWHAHVQGWLAASAGRRNIVVVKYEELRDDYARTIEGFEAVLGARPGSDEPPRRGRNTIDPAVDGPILAMSKSPQIAKELRAFATASFGETLQRLGY
jgi:Sulfotransferase domain